MNVNYKDSFKDPITPFPSPVDATIDSPKKIKHEASSSSEAERVIQKVCRNLLQVQSFGSNSSLESKQQCANLPQGSLFPKFFFHSSSNNPCRGKGFLWEKIKFLGKGQYGVTDLVRYNPSKNSENNSASQQFQVGAAPTLAEAGSTLGHNEYSPTYIYGEVSHLASTKGIITYTRDGEAYVCPRNEAFVCKTQFKSKSNGTVAVTGTKESYETKLLSGLAHPCIVSYIDSYEDDHNSYLITEYMDCGDLCGILKKLPGLISKKIILNLFVQITLGLEYLHRHNILHRDLKTANILLSCKQVVKLADFGFAKQYNRDVGKEVSLTTLGTLNYMSPEVVCGKEYGSKADMWALGVILFELITLKRPFTGLNEEEIVKNIVHNNRNKIERTDLPPELIALVESLLDPDPNKRPSAIEVLRQPMMTQEVVNLINKYNNEPTTKINSTDQKWVEQLWYHLDLIRQI